MVSIDKSAITVTMNLKQYEHYEYTESKLNDLIKMLERANKDGVAVMTDELKTAIEEIYC